MSDFGPEIVAEVVAACQAGAREAADAFSRTFGAPCTLTVGEPSTFKLEALPQDFDGPGLAIVLSVGGLAALVLLPESSRIVPEWYANPDPTGQSKLTTLAQELGMLVLPERFMPDDFTAARVVNLRAALSSGGVATHAALVPLELSAGGQAGTVRLIWPAQNPAGIFLSAPAAAPKPKPAAKPSGQPAAKPTSPSRAQASARPGRRPKSVNDLPTYARHLLRIKVPVVVTLAVKKQPISRIVELGPGSIIQFEKSCEEQLQLEVGDRPLALGQAVKVGDKFGLKVSSLVLPEERLMPLANGEKKGRK
ncbi:MAG: FliM/FliN family flagellar motor switch protein [Pirellulales bacterium]